ncbi:hypothetical protein BVC80_1835g470 [Macleaya cordata]|uniref:Uncharacterized protein n=1 Tax=Macleaya cordata TaxID=56857 RepID=A0A200R5T8_MACCD|nr:hypothetical protein BVC80_1835g470 [Macleaya cordata]
MLHCEESSMKSAWLFGSFSKEAVSRGLRKTRWIQKKLIYNIKWNLLYKTLLVRVRYWAWALYRSLDIGLSFIPNNRFQLGLGFLIVSFHGPLLRSS